MTGERHTRAQLQKEIEELRRRVLDLEKVEEDLRLENDALSKGEVQYRSASALVSDQVFRVVRDEKGQLGIQLLLGELGKISGYKRDTVRYPDEWKEIVHPDDWESVEGFLRAVLGGEKASLELRIQHKDGGVRWVSVVGMPERDNEGSNGEGVLCCVKEITQAKVMEEEVRRKAAYFRSAVESMTDRFGIFTAVRGEAGEILDFRVDYLNPVALTKSPLKLEDLLGKTVVKAMLGDLGREHFKKLCRLVETGEPLQGDTLVYDDIYEGKPRRRTFEVSAAKLGDGFCTAWRDVTTLRRAEQETRVAQERLEFLLSATPAVIYTARPCGNYGATFISKNVEQLTGFESERFLENSRFWLDQIHPDDVERVLAEVPRVFENDRHTYEYRFRCKDGDYAWLSDDMKLVRDDRGTPREIVGYWTDVSERKHTEQELIRLERLRALGQMAAGVSHNLNNMLTTILGPAKLLHQEIDDPDLLRETEFILTSARRAKDLVRRLNEAVRGGPEGGLGPVSANKVVEEAVEITRPIWKDEAEGKNITIDLETDLGEVPPVRGTHSGLNDIVINLMLNAVDALTNGGSIRIGTKAVGNSVQLTMSDTGQGMDEITKRRVFEPFFSTKIEIGTGLGLSTVYGTVTRWGGAVDVESAPGAGTTFKITLPAWTESEVTEEMPVGDGQARRARVLVVEDVEPICALLSRLLSSAHDVEVVLSGREALERFSPGRYDLAIIDLGLSGITGDRVGRLMRQADSALATILISGWDITEGDPRMVPFDFWLEKPFDDLKQVEAVVAKAVQLHDSRVGGQ